MATPKGLWIRLSVRYPNNRKVRPLSDAAFRLHIELMCWAKDEGTGGLIDGANMELFGRPKARAELVKRGLLEDAGNDDWALHDYDEWQDLDADTEVRRVRQSKGGSRGNHDRWHVKRGIVAIGCEFCASVDRSGNRSDTDRVTDPKLIG